MVGDGRFNERGNTGKAIASDGVIAAMFDPVLQRFLVESAKAAIWTGSVCTGAFILAAAGLLEGCKTTTYWSQIPNLKLLAEKQKFDVAEGYPRSVFDRATRRFTGGGVSSSIDLALELVAIIRGSVAAAQASQLSIQYAPKPPVEAGDPSVAPAALVKQIENDQQTDFILPIQKAVRQLLAALS
jgi:cyclohexyl-isocyanide hydratase